MCNELKNELKEAIALVKQCLEQTDEILSILKELSTPKAGVTNCEHLKDSISDIIPDGINFTWDKSLSKELTDSLK